MGFLNLEKLKRREKQLDIPLVDMSLVAALFGAVGLLGALWIVVATASIIRGGAAILLLWQLGLFSAAGSVGFLFGHPRVSRVQAARDTGAAKPAGAGADSAAAVAERLLQPSTALQDIVDWLTKIIVGVGLIELKQVPTQIDRLAVVISLSVGAVSPMVAATPDQLKGVAVAVVVSSVGCGFVFGYLMTRLYLQGAINRADAGLSANASERLQVSANLTVDRDVPTDVFSPDEASWDQDPNKGNFGGKSEATGWRLTARIKPKIDSDKPVCDVNLSVQSDDSTATGLVTFYLHPSFNQPKPTRTIDNGIATLDLVAWGAFTVGAVIVEKGKGFPTRLELDLVDVPGGTPRFYEE